MHKWQLTIHIALEQMLNETKATITVASSNEHNFWCLALTNDCGGNSCQTWHRHWRRLLVRYCRRNCVYNVGNDAWRLGAVEPTAYHHPSRRLYSWKAMHDKRFFLLHRPSGRWSVPCTVSVSCICIYSLLLVYNSTRAQKCMPQSWKWVQFIGPNPTQPTMLLSQPNLTQQYINFYDQTQPDPNR